MNVPEPLPVVGDWIVTADGGEYQIVTNCRHRQPCTLGSPAADGCWYLAVDSGEMMWTDWSNVEGAGSAQDMDALSERLTGIIEAENRRKRAARRITAVRSRRLVPLRVDRVLLTITSDQQEAPGPRTVAAFATLAQAALSAAGILATVTAEMDA